MPCSDGGWERYLDKSAAREEGYKDGAKGTKHEAILCALTCELGRRGILDEVVFEAEKNGKVEIRSFISSHIQEDVNRLIQDIDKYSEDELGILRRILGVKEGE